MSEPPADVNGILIAPPGMPIPKGTEIMVGVPPALDLDEATQVIDRPLLAICGIARSADPEQHPAFAFVQNTFVVPEVVRRREAGALQEQFGGIRSALVIFPAESPGERRILLNDEIRVQAQVRVKYGGVEAGDPVRVSDLYDLTGLRLEGVREAKDAFFWVTQEPGRFALYFDLVPVLRDAEMPDEARAELHREIMDAMAQEHLRGFLRHAFDVDPAVQERMSNDGWVPSPVLLPDTWASMCRDYLEGREVDAEARAAEYVTRERADAMLGA